MHAATSDDMSVLNWGNTCVLDMPEFTPSQKQLFECEQEYFFCRAVVNQPMQPSSTYPKLAGISSKIAGRLSEKLLDQFEAKNGLRPSQEKHPVFYQEMMQKIEQTKISLSVHPQTQQVLFCEGKQLQITLTRQMFNEWVKDLAEKTIQITETAIKEANLKIADIDHVYAVGGGSMMPIIVEMLETLTGKKISRKCEPHCAAAMGAVIAGRIEYERQGKTYKCGDVALPGPGIFLRDILSHSIGVLVVGDNDKDICFEILAKDTPIPSIQTKMFKLYDPCQTEVAIKLLQGINGQPSNQCVSLGHFELKDLPKRPDMIGRIEITYTLDANGILSAKARDIVSGKQAEMEIEYKSSINANQKVV